MGTGWTTTTGDVGSWAVDESLCWRWLAGLLAQLWGGDRDEKGEWRRRDNKMAGWKETK